jgi:hypothetical protein
MYSGTGGDPGFAVSAGKVFQSSIGGSPSRVVEHMAIDFDLGLSTHSNYLFAQSSCYLLLLIDRQVCK